MPLNFTHRPSLIAYVTCGDPDLATTLEISLAAINAGADVIELGVPFSDPLADGPVIQRASQRALHGDTSLRDVLELAAKVRKQSDGGLIIFSYLNPIMRVGWARFAGDAKQAGVDGALITDLPIEESSDYRHAMQKSGLATVFLAAPTSPEKRLKEIATASNGFVYAISRTGVTGARRQFPDDARKLVGRLRKYTKLPVAVGFGISTPEQFASIGEFAEAAVVGSAIVETVERNPGDEAKAVAKFVRMLVGGRK